MIYCDECTYMPGFSDPKGTHFYHILINGSMSPLALCEEHNVWFRGPPPNEISKDEYETLLVLES